MIFYQDAESGTELKVPLANNDISWATDRSRKFDNPKPQNDLPEGANFYLLLNHAEIINEK